MMCAMVVAFWVAFLATVAMLAVAVWTGIRGRRRAHFAAVACFIAGLVVTVRFTRGLTEAIAFPKDELEFHLRFAIGASALLLPVLVTGLVYAIRGGRLWRMLHRAAVIVFVLAVLLATGTGVRMFLIAG